jgi:hypothetical protein
MKRRRWRKEFDLCNSRVHELARLVKARGGIASDAILLAVAQSLLWTHSINFNRTDQLPRRLSEWVRTNAPTVPHERVTEAVERATDHPYPQGADRLARSIGLSYAERQRLKIKAIGADDATKEQRKQFAKERKRICDRIRRERQRREAGAIPRDEYLAQSVARQQPWLDDGVSKRTWYRRRKLLGTGASLVGTGASPILEPAGGTGPSRYNSSPTARRHTSAAANVPALAHAGGTGNPPALSPQSKPAALAGDGSGFGRAEKNPQPPFACTAEGWRASAPAGSAVAREPAVEVHSKLSPNRDSRSGAAKGARAKRLRAEQAGQLNWLAPTRGFFLGQPVRAACAGAGRAEASVPPRAAAASKLSPEVFRRMAKLQRWGISADRVTAWHRHVSDAVIEELFATAVRRNRGPSDAREWLEEQMQCAMSDPHYESPTRPERRRRPAKPVLATYDKSGARVLTRGGIAKLLEEVGEPMTKDQLGPLLGIMVSNGSLILMSRGRYRRPDAEQQSEAPSSSKREMVS